MMVDIRPSESHGAVYNKRVAMGVGVGWGGGGRVKITFNGKQIDPFTIHGKIKSAFHALLLRTLLGKLSLATVAQCHCF